MPQLLSRLAAQSLTEAQEPLDMMWHARLSRPANAAANDSVSTIRPHSAMADSAGPAVLKVEH